MTARPEELFELGRRCLRSLGSELAARKVNVSRGMALRRGKGVLCHYDAQDGHIYLSVPDAASASGSFELFWFRSLLGFESDDEVMRLIELLIPWLIAHEAGHALRHGYGLLSHNTWHEELIANQLASAFVIRYHTRERRNELRRTLARAIGNMPDHLCPQAEFEELNSVDNLVCYVYFHMRWLADSLAAHKQYSIDAFINGYLRQPAQTARLVQQGSGSSSGLERKAV